MPKKRDRSHDSHAVLDETSRRRKANKIISVLSAYTDLKSKKILDIGTGSGYMAERFSEVATKVISVDVVDERRIKNGYEYRRVENETLPFDDNSFDIVITNHVIEHVLDQRAHIKQITRVVKNNGYIYLATPNKYWITDPHYRLPFLPLMGRKLGSKYIRLFRRGEEWDVYPVSDHMLKALLRPYKGDLIIPEMLKNPSKFDLDVMKTVTGFSKFLPPRVLKLAHYASPTLIYVIKKE